MYAYTPVYFFCMCSMCIYIYTTHIFLRTDTKLANPSATSPAAQEIVKRIVGYIYKAAKAHSIP